jgi:hypothetical protein
MTSAAGLFGRGARRTSHEQLLGDFGILHDRWEAARRTAIGVVVGLFGRDAPHTSHVAFGT